MKFQTNGVQKPFLKFAVVFPDDVRVTESNPERGVEICDN